MCIRDRSKVAIVGGGAAGMMAAFSAASSGHQVDLFEHNEKLGKKIYITGKGSCNLTNACDVEDYFGNIVRNSKFLYSAIYTFDNQAVMDFFEEQGLGLKVERGNRVFPNSDHASDVIKALTKALRHVGVKVHLNMDVVELLADGGRIKGLKYHNFDTKEMGNTYFCDAVILAGVGISYPTTGSDGSTWELCKKLGHTITPVRPALIGMTAKECYIKELQGLSLKNISFSVLRGKKVLYQEDVYKRQL